MDTSGRPGTLGGLLRAGRDLVGQIEQSAAAGIGLSDDDRARVRYLGGQAVQRLGRVLRGARGGGPLVAVLALVVIGRLGWDIWHRHDDPTVPVPVPPDDSHLRAERLLWAMLAAARADGSIDAVEQSQIDAALADLPYDVRHEIDAVMARPTDPDAIARDVTDDSERRDIYAAAFMMVGLAGDTERIWLEQLAQALGLSPFQTRAIERDTAPT
jgi:uncharacterized membrane protein YebE (DUF533 family)